MNWIKLIIGACFEVAWVIGLTHATHLWEWALTVIAITFSFILLLNVTKQIPVGTAYATFVGLGTSGVTLVDFLVFGEPFNVMKLMLIFVLLLGVIGLKLATTETEEAK
ncbi:DMT family transporter [Staphylococcus ratti]|uniref:Multidrug efflux SMR transporter n=1 Tax=Staphylococcus ratti TaxID=2892440 RepID=A0ABY3PCI0_9STAP|nr:multidrug efflux SMR transporter [Staphylococcus ratti]UEX90032.1 multidrug efflux SMR transporter [Staphylococcus ratti]